MNRLETMSDSVSKLIKRATGRLEHANLTVTDPDRSSALLKKLLGWEERWRGPGKGGLGETIHVGNDQDYLALYSQADTAGDFVKGVPLNHIGLQVDDLDAAEDVVSEAGLKPFGHANYEPGRRFYFFDWDGIEFEVVSYE